MSNFKDRVEGLRKAREAELDLKAVSDASQAQRDLEEKTLRAVQLQTLVEQDPRYNKIQALFNDPQIQDAINFMFSEMADGHAKDVKPHLILPAIPRRGLGVNVLSSETDYSDTMCGIIEFKAGYYEYDAWDGSSEGPGSYVRIKDYRFKFWLNIMVDENLAT